MTPDQYSALRAHILSDPALAELAGPAGDGTYAASKDELIAAALRSDIIAIIGPLVRSKLMQWATATGHRALIEDHATDSASPLRSIALTLRDVLSGALESIDLSDAANVALLDAWLAGTVADVDARAAQRAALLALASTQSARFGPIHNLDIARAFGRCGPEG